MSDLISREAFISTLVDEVNAHNDKWFAGIVDAFIREIRKAPAVDAVDVVRCKDCKWADPCICVVCEEGKTVVCGKFHIHANKDGFCSYGERKEVSECVK